MVPVPDNLVDAAEALIRGYKMNWSSLKIIHRADRSLGVGVEMKRGVEAVHFLFNANTNEMLGQFSGISEAEALVRREASRVYGSVRSEEEAAARYDGLLKVIGGA